MRAPERGNSMTRKIIARVSLSERVYERILSKLLNRELLPGQIINRRSVAKELGVSIAPVLEALVWMEAEGLVTTLPRKGTQVRLIQVDEVADQMVVREAVECQAARLYCGEPIVVNQERLKKLADEADLPRNGPIDTWKAEIAFHRALVELSTCKSLLATFQQVMHLGALCATELYYSMRKDKTERKHRQLLESLKTRNPDAAESAIREHMQSGKQVVFHRPPAAALSRRAS